MSEHEPRAGAEHFVTFFDHRFLVQGLALHESLRRWLPEATLWVVCLDDLAAAQITSLALPGLRALPLEEVETDTLRAAKATRSRVEYIYTLTPFTYEFVSAVVPDVRRITYVDADLYLFADPKLLFDELDASGKSVLMTEHGYAPRYASIEATSGRFCVQFLPVIWDANGRTVVRDWQQKCLGGTGTGADRGKVFGDQKYLEDWPRDFPDAVHVSGQIEQMLGPWNADFQQRRNGAAFRPVFYHFHSLRMLPAGWIQLCAGYDVTAALPLYEEYLQALRRQRAVLRAAGIPLAPPHVPAQSFWLLRLLWRQLGGRVVLRRW